MKTCKHIERLILEKAELVSTYLCKPFYTREDIELVQRLNSEIYDLEEEKHRVQGIEFMPYRFQK